MSLIRQHLTLLAAVAWGMISLSACGDTCRKVDCGIGGFCHEGACVCEKWYSGANCELMYNRNYEGEYVGVEETAGRAMSQVIEVLADEAIPNRMNLPSGLYYEFDSDSTLIIPVQSVAVNNDTILVSGSGTYTLYTLELLYQEMEHVSEDPAALVGGQTISFRATRSKSQ